MRKFDDGPMTLTSEESEFIARWLKDQRETWANVGDREMLFAVDVLLEQVEADL